MGRKSNPHKTPISGKIRARMCRQRKKLKLSIRQKEQRVFSNNVAQIDVVQAENPLNGNIESHFKTKIRDWANMHRISKRAIDDLLCVLISSGIDSVPKNHRTLQKTPTNIVITDVSGGQFWYNGLGKCIAQIFYNLDRDIRISLNFNIDGLPLYKSSSITFYPILASIHGTHSRKIRVILIFLKHENDFRVASNRSNGCRNLVWERKANRAE